MIMIVVLIARLCAACISARLERAQKESEIEEGKEPLLIPEPETPVIVIVAPQP